MTPLRSIGDCLAAGALALLLLGPAPAHPQEPASLEYRVKAAFVVNFVKFTTWPERSFVGPASPIVIGIIGDDPFGDAFVPFLGGTVAGRNLEIRRFAPEDDNAISCHLLFIAPSAADGLEQIVARLGRAPVLTVSDIAGSCGRGPIICLYPKNNRISFDIDNARARRADLTISAKLLSLARRVRN